MVSYETYRGTVYPWHCDFNGHVNVRHYVGKFDEASWHFLAKIGLPPNFLKSENTGVVAVEQKFNYLKELVPGDLIYVTSRAISVGEKSISFEHQMKDSDSEELLAKAEITAVYIDKASRKAIPLPPKMVERLQEELSDSYPF